MRRKFIEALTYPRMLMTSNMDVAGCPMHLYFDPGNRSCQHCQQSLECRWLNNNDEFSILLQQPLDKLAEAFSFTVEYVDAHISSQEHNSRRCACETCRWLRQARRLVREYEDQTTH